MSQNRAAQLALDLEVAVQPRAKYLQPSLRVRCEERAAELYTVAIKASGLSNRAVARRHNTDERIVRDDKDGNRAVHVWKVLALPIEAQVAFARALIANIADQERAGNDEPSGDDEEARCA